MRTILLLLRRSRFFLIPWCIFLAGAGIILIAFPKPEIHLCINRCNDTFGDRVMPWITLLGDGWTVTVLVLLLFIYNWRTALFTGISCILSSGITQLLKHTIYYGVPRPKLFFHNSQLHFVPGVVNYLYDSFPSGHSTLIFAFFFSLAVAGRAAWFQVTCFVLALLVAYSRVYLSQHFLGDVYGGSVIGTLTALIVMAFAVNRKWIKLAGI